MFLCGFGKYNDQIISHISSNENTLDQRNSEKSTNQRPNNVKKIRVQTAKRSKKQKFDYA